MANQRRSITAGLFFGLIAAQLFAAASEDPVIRFTVFSSEQIDNVAVLVKPAPDPKYENLRFSSGARSPAHTTKATGSLSFVDATTHELVARADIPKDLTDALLIFSQTKAAGSGGLRYSVYVHDDSTTKHAAGGLAVLNFSGLELNGNIGAHGVTLGQGYYGPYEVGKTVKILLRTTVKQRGYQSMAESVKLGANGRALLLLFPPFYKGSIEVQSRVLLDEFIPAK